MDRDIWEPVSWYCPNCGILIIGSKNQNGDIKVVCDRCSTVMVRKIKSKRHDTIDLYAPKGQERIG